MKEAIGLIETMGIIAAIEASDVMLKTSNIELVSKEIVKGGLVTVIIKGDVSAVKTAVDSAVAAVNKLGIGLLMGSHVIPRPDRSVELILTKEKIKSEVIVEESLKTEEIHIDEKETIIGVQEEDQSDVKIKPLVVPNDLSQEEIKLLLQEHKIDLIREYLLNQTVAQLRDIAKQYNDFAIERKNLYRTNKAELVESIIDYLGNESELK